MLWGVSLWRPGQIQVKVRGIMVPPTLFRKTPLAPAAPPALGGCSGLFLFQGKSESL